MSRVERVEHDGYSAQDPRDVARQLGYTARMFAHVLSRLSPDGWDRTLIYNYPQPAEQPVRWVAVHA